MIKFKKHYNLKIISILITLVFCLNTLVYGIDIQAETHLRPRLVFGKDNKSLVDILIAHQTPQRN